MTPDTNVCVRKTYNKIWLVAKAIATIRNIFLAKIFIFV